MSNDKNDKEKKKDKDKEKPYIPRNTWKINPVQRVKEDATKYKRRKFRLEDE